MPAKRRQRNLSPLMLLLTSALWLSSPGSQAQDASSNLIATCVECHGTDGLAADADIPHIDGQPEHLLINMINAFRDGKRAPRVRIHREIAAADVVQLAQHYSQQKAARPQALTTPDLVQRGELIYNDRCADCHGDGGRESDKDAPLVAAQNLKYLSEQVMAFKSGERKFPFLMDKSYRDLSNDDLLATAHFFAAQAQVAPKQTKRKRR